MRAGRLGGRPCRAYASTIPPHHPKSKQAEPLDVRTINIIVQISCARTVAEGEAHRTKYASPLPGLACFTQRRHITSSEVPTPLTGLVGGRFMDSRAQMTPTQRSHPEALQNDDNIAAQTLLPGKICPSGYPARSTR